MTILSLSSSVNRPLSSNSKHGIFGIHGGGNIGLGCMAQIISDSPFNYYIIATSSDKLLNNLVNSSHRYWLQHDKETTLVNNITMIYSRNTQNIIWLYTYADLLAMCLTEKALLNMSNAIVKGLIARYHNNGGVLKILILMNKPRCDTFVQSILYKALLSYTSDQSYTDKLMDNVKFFPTVVDRIVNKISKRKLIKQLNYQVNQLNSDPKLLSSESLLNKEILKEASRNNNLYFSLLNVEKEFSFYVPASFEEAVYFPKMKTVKNIFQFADIKNKFINGPHSMLAWMGGLMGCSTIAEAINNPSMLWFVNQLMEREIGPILKVEYPNFASEELKLLKNSFVKRCKNSWSDPILRVGRDPLRKLTKGGRVRGIIELKQKHHLPIATPELERGMAAGILYAVKKIDDENEECKTIRRIYHETGSYQSILCYQGAYENGNYPGLHKQRDRALIQNVLKRIRLFEKILINK